MSDDLKPGLSSRQIAIERANLLARLEYLDGYDRMHAAESDLRPADGLATKQEGQE